MVSKRPRPGKKRLQVVVTLDDERQLKEAAQRDGYEEDLSGWIREAALAKAAAATVPTPFLGSVKSVRRLVDEYCFGVGELRTVVTVRLFEIIGQTEVAFDQSHFMRTPVQADAYRTSHPWGDNADDALKRVVEGLTHFYDAAVAAGHAPEESWLVENERFGILPGFLA